MAVANTNTRTKVKIQNSFYNKNSGFVVTGQYSYDGDDWKDSGGGTTNYDGECNIAWVLQVNDDKKILKYRFVVKYHGVPVETTRGENWGPPSSYSIYFYYDTNDNDVIYTHELICYASDGAFADGSSLKVKEETTKSKTKTWYLNTLEKPVDDESKCFIGWTNDEEEITRIQVSCQGDSKSTTTRIWSIWGHTIVFDANGGSCSESKRKVKRGAEVSVQSLPKAKKEGYDFLGWKKGEELLVSNIFFVTENITLVAIYGEKQGKDSIEIKVNGENYGAWEIVNVDGKSMLRIDGCNVGDAIEFIPKRMEKSIEPTIVKTVSVDDYKSGKINSGDQVFDFDSLSSDFSVTITHPDGHEIIKNENGIYGIPNLGADYQISFIGIENEEDTNIKFEVVTPIGDYDVKKITYKDGVLSVGDDDMESFSVRFSAEYYKPLTLNFQKNKDEASDFQIKFWDPYPSMVNIKPTIELYDGDDLELDACVTSENIINDRGETEKIIKNSFKIEFYKKGEMCNYNDGNIGVEFLDNDAEYDITPIVSSNYYCICLTQTGHSSIKSYKIKFSLIDKNTNTDKNTIYLTIKYQMTFQKH